VRIYVLKMDSSVFCWRDRDRSRRIIATRRICETWSSIRERNLICELIYYIWEYYFDDDISEKCRYRRQRNLLKGYSSFRISDIRSLCHFLYIKKDTWSFLFWDTILRHETLLFRKNLLVMYVVLCSIIRCDMDTWIHTFNLLKANLIC